MPLLISIEGSLILFAIAILFSLYKNIRDYKIIIGTIDKPFGLYRINKNIIKCVYSNIEIDSDSVYDIYNDFIKNKNIYRSRKYYTEKGEYNLDIRQVNSSEFIITLELIKRIMLNADSQKLMKDVEKALIDKQFSLYLQPIVNINNKTIVGYEALVRWLDGDRIRYPNDFIPVLETTGLMVSFCNMVVEEACIILKKWSNDDLKKHLHIAINLSPLTVCTAMFECQFNHIIDKYNINRSRLQLEITERYALEEPIVPKLSRLRLLGHDILLDDFGTGESNMSSLKTSSANYIKIDRSFIDGVSKDITNQSVVKTVITLAKAMNMEIIAEGIEKEEDASWLIYNGVIYGQGWLYGKPQAI